MQAQIGFPGIYQHRAVGDVRHTGGRKCQCALFRLQVLYQDCGLYVYLCVRVCAMMAGANKKHRGRGRDTHTDSKYRFCLPRNT